MPARRRNRKLKKKKPSGRKVIRLFAVFFFFIVFLGYLTLSRGEWDGKNKLAVVVNGDDGVSVIVFDPKLEEISKISIPGNTQVILSRQFGFWMAGSIWRLGINEGLDGKLLSESVSRHFRFPVFLWADKQALSFYKGNFFDLTKAVFSPYRNNLCLKDRLKLALFSMKVRDRKKTDIDLSNTSYLKKTTFIDGREGFEKTSFMPQNIALIFSEPVIAEKNLKMVIKNSTGNMRLAEEVGSFLEVLGIKVASVTKQENEDFDCEISGSSKEDIYRISKFLSCEIAEDFGEGNFDIELRLGEKFTKRY